MPERVVYEDDPLVGLTDMPALFGVQEATPYTWRYRDVLPPPDAEEGGSPLWRTSTLAVWWERRRAENAPGWRVRATKALERNVVPPGVDVCTAIGRLGDDPANWIEGRDDDGLVLPVLIHRPVDIPGQPS